MQELTPNKLEELIGKTIQWEAPIYEGNEGYYGQGLDGGFCKIEKIDLTKKRPIIDVITIEGADIRYAFNSKESITKESLDNTLCFSDGDRYVTYKII